MKKEKENKTPIRLNINGTGFKTILKDRKEFYFEDCQPIINKRLVAVRKEQILCYACDNLIDVTSIVEDYFEVDEEEIIEIITCEKCLKENAIYYTTIVSFDSRKPDKKELKQFQLI